MLDEFGNTTKEVAAYLGIKQQKVYKLLRKYNVGRNIGGGGYLINREEVLKIEEGENK